MLKSKRKGMESPYNQTYYVYGDEYKVEKLARRFLERFQNKNPQITISGHLGKLVFCWFSSSDDADDIRVFFNLHVPAINSQESH